MPQKRYRPEEIIAKLREAEVLLSQGKKVPEVVKVLGDHREQLQGTTVVGTGQCYLWTVTASGLLLNLAVPTL